MSYGLLAVLPYLLVNESRISDIEEKLFKIEYKLRLLYPFVTVYRDGDYAVVVDGKTKEVIARSTDHAEMVRKAIDSLTPNRTWKETVVVVGDFVISKSIVVPSHTRLVLLGRLVADENWNPEMHSGVIELGERNSVVEDVEIVGGKIVGNYFSEYPTASGKNSYVSGIHSYATIIEALIHNISFENLRSPITLEKLGANQDTPSRKITIRDIYFKNMYVGVQTYANGYAYRDVLIDNIRAENCYDDVVAVVGHYGGVPDAIPYVRHIIVENVIVHDKNGGAGAVVKIDAGDAYDGTFGRMSHITVENINAYTSSPDDNLIVLFKGRFTEHIILNNIQGRGEFKYGIWLQTRGKYIKITNFDIQANYQIFLQFTDPPFAGQDIQIEHGTLMPRESDVNSNTVAGYGIVLAAGASDQGVENLKVKDVYFMWTEYPIYEGDTPPAGVRGTYKNNYYEIDVGNRQYAHLVITSDPVVLKVYKRGAPITFNSGVATISAGSTRVTVSHGLAKAPRIILLTPAGNARVWYENVTNTSFDIVTDTAPSTDLNIAWYAEV